MKEAQQEIKVNLEHRLGEVSFDNNIMKILSHNIPLSESYITELEKQLSGFEDMFNLNIKIERVNLPERKAINYSVYFEPKNLYEPAMHHLRKITHGFIKKYCGKQRKP